MRQVTIESFTESDFKSSSALLNAINALSLLDPYDVEGAKALALKKKNRKVEIPVALKDAPLLTVMVRNIPNKYTQEQVSACFLTVSCWSNLMRLSHAD